MTFLTVLRPKISTNSTTTPLGIAETFTGPVEDVTDYSSITISVYSDVDSVKNGLILEFSVDQINWDVRYPYSVIGGKDIVLTVNTDLQYFRITYQNNSVAQTEFRLSAILNPYKPPPNNSVVIQNAISTFEELKTVERTPIIELKSTYGLSELRNIVDTTGTASVTQVAGSEYDLSTTANGIDSATLYSAERGRYQPGYSCVAGIGVRIPTLPIGNQVALWGLGDNENGFYFGVDTTGIFVEIQRSSAITQKIYQSDWNNDTCDGNGPSGQELVLSDGNIYQVEFSWYGYGVIQFVVYLKQMGVYASTRVLLHQLKIIGQTSIADPNQPIMATIDNGGTASPFELFVAGRQYSIIGRFDPNRRITSERIIDKTVGTSFEPLISFRRKSSFKSVSVKLDGLDTIASSNIIIEIRVNSTLTGASFGTPTDTTASETALESDTSSTAIDINTGNMLWSSLAFGSNNRNATSFSSTNVIDFDIPDLQPVSIVARAITGNATITMVFRMREEW